MCEIWIIKIQSSLSAKAVFWAGPEPKWAKQAGLNGTGFWRASLWRSQAKQSRAKRAWRVEPTHYGSKPTWPRTKWAMPMGLNGPKCSGLYGIEGGAWVHVSHAPCAHAPMLLPLYHIYLFYIFFLNMLKYICVHPSSKSSIVQ